jgi:pimeloyl-ACP methyl ester carboxylesterase
MDKVISRDGTPIAYDRYGSGPALILVGGAFQHRAFDAPTTALAERLGAHFTTYHYDRRGRGDSGDTAPYAVGRELDDIDALIAAAGGSAYLFGHSSGAAVTLDAVARGAAVPKVVLYEPPVVVDDTRPAVPADMAARLTALVAEGRRGEAVELFLTRSVRVPPEVVAQMRQSPVWPGFEGVAHTLAYDAAFVAGVTAGRPIPAERWGAVTVPVLVLDGGASPEWMHRAARAVTDALPDARRRTLPDQVHAVVAEVVAPELTSFFGTG